MLLSVPTLADCSISPALLLYFPLFTKPYQPALLRPQKGPGLQTRKSTGLAGQGHTRPRQQQRLARCRRQRRLRRMACGMAAAVVPCSQLAPARPASATFSAAVPHHTRAQQTREYPGRDETCWASAHGALPVQFLDVESLMRFVSEYEQDAPRCHRTLCSCRPAWPSWASFCPRRPPRPAGRAHPRIRCSHCAVQRYLKAIRANNSAAVQSTRREAPGVHDQRHGAAHGRRPLLSGNTEHSTSDAGRWSRTPLVQAIAGPCCSISAQKSCPAERLGAPAPAPSS